MDKNVLKKFAVESRQELMNKIANKIKTFYIDEGFSKEQNGDIIVLSNEKHSLSLSKKEYEDREKLKTRVKELGLEQVIEEAAYTWFNRIIAIRYMEIHDYLPLTKDNQSLGIRVLSSKDNTPDPEIMKFTNLTNPELDIDFKKEKYIELKDNNKKFEYILLLVCKKLGRVIPQVFDGITDYIDLLIPDNLLNDSGYINKLLKELLEYNFDEVEIIGWLYQYYISEKKEEVFLKIKNNSKVTSDNIPAATQLFTPDWIVKYLVQNSVGNYLQSYVPENLKKELKFYIVNQYANKLEKGFEKIKIFDPCCGSGHILVYAFELLYQIYKENGYNKNDICQQILKYNLFGVDIDERAIQLTILSLVLKAREYDKAIFNKKVIQDLNILSITDSKNIQNAEFDIISKQELRTMGENLIANFINAKEVGSLLKIEVREYDKLISILENDNTIFGYNLYNKINKIYRLYSILSNKYDIVITNPPYMSKRVYDKELSKYLENNYPISKYDLYTAFIEKNINDFCKENGIVAMVTIHTWMFISTFENLREYILKNYYIENMLHLGAATFEELNSFNVLATAFIIRKCKSNEKGVYLKLDKFLSPDEKIKNFNNDEIKYYVNQQDFFSVEGHPFVYWMTKNERDIFKYNNMVRNFGEIKQGMATSDNNRFLRLWTEVDFSKIGFGLKDNDEAYNSGKKWFPYNKGGDFKKWYGNNELVVNWENNGKEMKDYTSTLPQGTAVRLKSQDYYFKKGITWSLFGFENFGVRYKDYGYIFDISGSSMFFENDEDLLEMLAFLSSKVAFKFLTYLAPTVNFQIKNIGDLPYKTGYNKNQLVEIAKENIRLVKEDWDMSEISWDFKGINNYKANTLNESFNYFRKYNKNSREKLRTNEEYINKIYSEIYNLEKFDVNVIDRDLSIKLISQDDYVVRFISYALGCMFGRYSLDEEGLIYAGGDFDINRYKTFEVDTDNIIPITDEAYFGDDIVERFKDFLVKVYGKETLNENMDFIADTLNKKGTETSEERVRRYFNDEFYADHIKTYQKRPIYWLFDSGKKNGFKALVYMHRYNENLVPKVRLDYLHRVQTTYEKLLSDINYKLTTDLSMNEKKEAQKRQADLNAKLQETKEYDEKIAHIANQRISIDLDDGVKVNYAKFEDILAKIK